MNLRHFTFHLIPNAHLDPVWLWDWREGMNEGLITCRTILDLMDENRELTFIRGETAVYQHIERTDPATFARIRKYVIAGRWDPVGGTVIQPDTNLPDTETLTRQFTFGQRYFLERFGGAARAAWAADSFGHSAGLPEILRASGIEFFAFTRPAHGLLPIDSPAFWWMGPGGSRILAYRPRVGWYGCEREEITQRLDENLQAATAGHLHNVACFLGLGNHGGGPTRRHLAEIRCWAEHHPEVTLIFSGLHRFFDALKSEVTSASTPALPTHQGELNFALRGCYSSVAKLKYAFRRTENELQRAERTDAAVSIISGMNSGSNLLKAENSVALRNAWNGLLFNSFHDILPGTSIERALDDQMAWLGGAYHDAQRAANAALNVLASQVDTRLTRPKTHRTRAPGDAPSAVPMLVWNPHPHPYRGLLELEASLDYRPIWKYRGKPDALPVRVTGASGKSLPFQKIDTEHHSMVDLPWRQRVLIEADLPAFGWNVIEMAYDETARPILKKTKVGGERNQITNGIYTVRAKVGASGIEISRDGKPIFAKPGLGAVTVEDPWGSWGGMAEEPESLHLLTVRDHWKISAAKVLERGPLRATLWTLFEAGKSRLELTFAVSHRRACVDVTGRLLWNERSARLKLTFPCGDQLTFDVPGASIRRKPGVGEVPGGRWVRVAGRGEGLGFASDSLYNFDACGGIFRATVCRATRYADNTRTEAGAQPWRPAVDAGELKFKFLLTSGKNPNLPLLAQELEQPPIAQLVPPHPGEPGRIGSLASLEPRTLKMMALKRAENGMGLILRIRETGGRDTMPQFVLGGRPVRLTMIPAYRITTWRLTQNRKGWVAHPSDAIER